MSVMIQVEFLLYPVGHSDFLHAFFSTMTLFFQRASCFLSSSVVAARPIWASAGRSTGWPSSPLAMPSRFSRKAVSS